VIIHKGMTKMQTKKALLISPAFPDDSFWSYKHVIRYVGRKAAFPPLGVLSFAAMMPEDWEFELLDMNIRHWSTGTLRRKIQQADVIFAGAMNIQRDSLVDLLEGPARGTDTPWVLGGPMASTYRDTVLQPTTESDQILHDGLDLLVWGEAQPWIGALIEWLEENPKHTTGTPHLLIPERVLQEPEGSRKYLLDKEIFKPLDNLPAPRWDLINVLDYRAMMIQTTAGCRFRCNFCDIVQFNGGFARAKDKAGVMQELQSIYDSGFRGSVFTVDDNFVSEPEAMETILEGMIEFQRANDYPFNFFTQASVDLGKESLDYLVPLMRQAGFTAVFLGIENPDPAALKAMNKIQNVKTSPEETVRKLQVQGIEVFAGFIFGTDGDTLKTADLIVDFVTKNGIFSSMTGKLTPMPHTPLYVDLKEQGRLIGGVDARNNIDETAQFHPMMGTEHLHQGFTHILATLFDRKALYGRARDVLDRVELHIFRGRILTRGEYTAVLHSIVKQGLRKLDGEYFRFLREALKRDREGLAEIRGEATRFTDMWNTLRKSSAHDRLRLEEQDVEGFGQMLPYAHDALVRYGADKGLSEVGDIVQGFKESLGKGDIAVEQGRLVYERAMVFCEARMGHFKFPGVYLARAFELCIIGKHYKTCADNVINRADSDSMMSPV
jgi:radical SAM superfamily enzyme YgiQ (UPF0313 family)